LKINYKDTKQKRLLSQIQSDSVVVYYIEYKSIHLNLKVLRQELKVV